MSAWDDDENGSLDTYYWPQARSIDVDDRGLMQPIGFVWFSKPKYRVKANMRKIEKASANDGLG